MRRRDLLKGGVAASVAVAVPAKASTPDLLGPDTRIQALYHEAMTTKKIVNTSGLGCGQGEAGEGLFNEHMRVHDALMNTPANTLQGVLHKIKYLYDECITCAEQVYPVFDDVERLLGSAPTPLKPVQPDPLVGMYADWRKAIAACDAAYEAGADDIGDAHYETADSIEDKMLAIPAVTVSGATAKLRLAADRLSGGRNGSCFQTMANDALADLDRLGGAS